MKKLKNIAIAFGILVIAGGYGAYALTNNDELKVITSISEELHWFDPSMSSFLGSNTIDDQEANAGGCVRNEEGCQKGYTEDQLIDKNNPAAGVKTNEVGNPAATLGLPI